MGPSPSSRRAGIEISGNSKNGSPALVALLAEGGDRNTSGVSAVVDWFVALLAEGGDRNTTPSGKSVDAKVALLAEGGDRNLQRLVPVTHSLESPSSRRAGIEIAYGSAFWAGHSVALLAEGGDRNSRSIGIISDAQLSPSSRRAGIEIGYTAGAADR